MNLKDILLEQRFTFKWAPLPNKTEPKSEIQYRVVYKERGPGAEATDADLLDNLKRQVIGDRFKNENHVFQIKQFRDKNRKKVWIVSIFKTANYPNAADLNVADNLNGAPVIFMDDTGKITNRKEGEATRVTANGATDAKTTSTTRTTAATTTTAADTDKAVSTNSTKASVNVVAYDPAKSNVEDANVQKFQQLIINKLGSMMKGVVPEYDAFLRVGGADGKYGTRTKNLIDFLEDHYGVARTNGTKITPELQQKIEAGV